MSQNSDKAVRGVPGHVAVIMDGNGRWAKARHLPRVEGHRRGVASVRACTEEARRLGIRALSLFAFSSENWGRPADEVSTLMGLFVEVLGSETTHCFENDIRIVVAGDRSRFSPRLRATIASAEERTASCGSMVLTICANYGGKWDIVNAFRSILTENPALAADPSAITEAMVSSRLALPLSGDVDLLIRTGGECRVSNFLLWQSAYAEIYFSDELWPDFREGSLRRAVDWYRGRERRFGLTSEQVAASG